MEELRQPVVTPVGYVQVRHQEEEAGVLITRYLDYSLPYHYLFKQPDLARYRDHLMDALAGLLVQLHLAGVYWGDCSLSNTLYRRDAGAHLSPTAVSIGICSRISPDWMPRRRRPDR